MTPQLLIDHVNQSIDTAMRHQSWIDVEILGIKGFSTGEMRRLFSNLTHLPKPDPCYAEVGLYCGGTFCAAMNNNPTLTCYGVENFSQAFGDPTVREQLMANVDQFKGVARHVEVFDSDCFELDLKKFKLPVDVIFLDPEHSYETQYKAITYYFDTLAPISVVVVDDYHWHSVSQATQDALNKLVEEGRAKVERQWLLSGDLPQDDPKLHNGLGIFVLSKLK